MSLYCHLALHWTPKGTRVFGRPNTTWRKRGVERELETMERGRSGRQRQNRLEAATSRGPMELRAEEEQEELVWVYKLRWANLVKSNRKRYTGIFRAPHNMESYLWTKCFVFQYTRINCTSSQLSCFIRNYFICLPWRLSYLLTFLLNSKNECGFGFSG